MTLTRIVLSGTRLQGEGCGSGQAWLGPRTAGRLVHEPHRGNSILAARLSQVVSLDSGERREMLDGPVRSDVENRLMIHGPWPARVDEEFCLLSRAKLNAGGLDRFS